MEFVEGQTLRAMLESGPIPVPRLLDLAIQMATGLAKAHAGGIVHRDLTPENLMITTDGLVKILDFGLARLDPEVSRSSGDSSATLTRGGVLMGTVQYMSPEQARTPSVDHRSDQFTMGLILFEMATDQRALARDSVGGTLAAIMFEEHEPIAHLNREVPASLQSIIATCLAKAPEARFANTADLQLSGASTPTRPASNGSRQSGFPRPDRARVRALRGGPRELVGCGDGSALLLELQ